MGGEAAHFGLFRYEIKGVADHLGGFRAWIPERSDFFKGPKGPKGPLGPSRNLVGGKAKKKEGEIHEKRMGNQKGGKQI